MDWNDTKIWLAIGFLGNALFFSRFMVQWVASERAGRSYIPTMFWWLSIAGSIVLLLYAVHKRDPVFIIAYLPNCVVYVRNLMLIRKQERHSAPDPTPIAVREPEAAKTTASTDAMVSGSPSRT
jgi:lipid-A-disaccharide synthase-like uncharacterized protein